MEQKLQPQRARHARISKNYRSRKSGMYFESVRLLRVQTFVHVLIEHMVRSRMMESRKANA